MARFRFVHAAALRLDAPFAAVARVPERVRNHLAEAPLRAWDDLVSVCIDKGAAFLVVAGGILDGCEPQSSVAPLRLRNGLKRLAEHGIQSFLALGEHDRRLAPLLAEAGIAGVTVFPADRPLTVTVEHKAAAIASVAGESSGGDCDVDRFFAGAREGLPLIGVLPAAPDDLDRRLAARGKSKGAYWALGGSDEPSRRGFSPWIVEAGCLQGRNNAAGQRGARGAMLVEVEGDRVVAVDHCAVDRVRYAETTLTPRFPLDDALLSHQILDELNRLRAAHAGRALLVDMVVEERGGAHPLDLGGRRRALLQRLRDETASWDPFVWCASLRAAPAPIAEAGGDPFAQAIIDESRALLANPLQRSYTFARRFEPLMRKWTSELDSDDAERLISEATAAALAVTRHDVEPAPRSARRDKPETPS